MIKIVKITKKRNNNYKSLTKYLPTILIIGIMLVASSITINVFAQKKCSVDDTSYIVKSGDYLSKIATANNTAWQSLASYNNLLNPSLIFVGQTICIPNSTGVETMTNIAPIHGTGNYFAFPQCTFHANDRYHQLHGVYVPWTTQSNANQWVDRAHEFHWYVTNTAKMGSIVSFQGGTQGAYSLGHVAVVEQLLGNGKFIASSLDWGNTPSVVTNYTFHEGPGVNFIAHF